MACGAPLDSRTASLLDDAGLNTHSLGNELTQLLNLADSLLAGLGVLDGRRCTGLSSGANPRLPSNAYFANTRFSEEHVVVDGNLITAKKLKLITRSASGKSSRARDIGLVGEVQAVNPLVLDTLDRSRFIPIIAPIGGGEDGSSYNINADTVAGKIASALKAEKLMLLTDTEGVLDERGQLISSMDEKKASRLIEKGQISGGMIPKVRCCLQALKEGVGKAHIIDGRIRHAILLEVFTDVGIGTQITG